MEENEKQARVRFKSFVNRHYQGHTSRFAKVAGMYHSTILRWQEGSRMTFDNFLKLQYGGVNLVWLMTGNGSEYADNDAGDKLRTAFERNVNVVREDTESYNSAHIVKRLDDINATLKRIEQLIKDNNPKLLQ